MRIYGERAVDHHHERVAVGGGPGDLAGGYPAIAGGLFSMITGCRMDSDSRSAMARATRSLAPPAAVVTTR